MCKKAIIAMSGGVDSSVAALLMKEKGYTCMGATMKLYQNEDIGLRREHTCCSLDDVEDARSVAYALDMPYYVFNFADRFKTDVIDKFVHSYETGVTPNPCIDCNRYLKFDKLFQRMVELNYDYVVTGHYAQIDFDENTGRYLLKKAVDHNKDQSYVLWSLTQEQLKHVQFPLGGMEKCEVRALAEAHNFINARKHDSQDICFVQNGSYADFIEQYTGKTYPPGDFVDTDGNVLGQHRGVIRYTIGQRKGLGLALPAPLYVKSVDIEKNTVTLSPESENTSGTSEFETSELQASFVKFATDASAGDSMIFAYDDASYKYLDQDDLEGFFGPVDGTDNDYYLWKDIPALNNLELNHYNEEGATKESVLSVLGELKVAVRTEDGAAFKKQEKIDYRNDSVKLYERLLNDEPANTEN